MCTFRPPARINPLHRPSPIAPLSPHPLPVHFQIRSSDVSDDDSCDSSSPLSSLHLDRTIDISLNLNPALPTAAARSRPNALCARAPDASGGPHPPAEPLPLPLLFLIFPAAGRYLPRWARALASPARGELAGGGTSPDHAPLLGGVGGSGGGNASSWPAARACGDGDLLSPSIIGRWRRRHVSCEMRSPVAMAMLPPLHGSHGDRCLLSPAQRSRLVGHLPASISLCDWELLYSTEQVRRLCTLRSRPRARDHRTYRPPFVPNPPTPPPSPARSSHQSSAPPYRRPQPQLLTRPLPSSPPPHPTRTAVRSATPTIDLPRVARLSCSSWTRPATSSAVTPRPPGTSRRIISGRASPSSSPSTQTSEPSTGLGPTLTSCSGRPTRLASAAAATLACGWTSRLNTARAAVRTRSTTSRSRRRSTSGW